MALPILTALELDQDPRLPEGTTYPLLMNCAAIQNWEQGPKPYVVKLANQLEHQKLSIIYEIIGGGLARHFNIPIPEYAMIDITEKLRQAAYKVNGGNPLPDHILSSINANIGDHNFGSKFIYPTFNPIMPEKYDLKQEDKFELMATIFAFDALIYNADRTDLVANMFETDTSYIIYDHEKAFNFVANKEIPKNFEFRLPGPHNDRFMHQHLFWQFLKKQKDLYEKDRTNIALHNFTQFFDLLDLLEDNIIKEITDDIPSELKRPHSTEIKLITNHLKHARANQDRFLMALLGVLQ